MKHQATMRRYYVRREFFDELEFWPNRNVVCDVYVRVDNRRPILDRFKSTIRARNIRFWKKNTPAENLDGPLEHGCLPNFFRVYYIQIDVRIDVRVEMLLPFLGTFFGIVIVLCVTPLELGSVSLGWTRSVAFAVAGFALVVLLVLPFA
jgi:hypothetical protein